jgi:hypothetical protein
MGSTQPLRKMSTRNLPKGKEGPAHLWADCLENVGASTSHKTMGLHGLLQDSFNIYERSIFCQKLYNKGNWFSSKRVFKLAQSMLIQAMTLLTSTRRCWIWIFVWVPIIMTEIVVFFVLFTPDKCLDRALNFGLFPFLPHVFQLNIQCHRIMLRYIVWDTYSVDESKGYVNMAVTRNRVRRCSECVFETPPLCTVLSLFVTLVNTI